MYTMKIIAVVITLLMAIIKTTSATPTVSTPTLRMDDPVMMNDTKLLDSVGNVVDMFGWSLAVTSTHFACGILHSDGPGFRKVGSVFIYSRQGSVLTWNSELTAPKPDNSIGFGNAIALNGRHIVVSSEDKNAVYVHDLQNNNALRQELSSPGGSATDKFGASVGISSDDTIIVGADKSSKGSRQETGTVYVFKPINGGKWTQTLTLGPSELTDYAHFGHSLGITTTYIGVAAAGQTVSGITQAGCVYVFPRNANKTHFTSLTSPNPQRNDGFGYSVSFGEKRIVIATEKGKHVYIFKTKSRDSNDWIVETKLSQLPRDQGFGASVSIHQNKLLVAADKCKGRVENSGCAYIYVRTKGGKWTFERKLIANDQRSHETFGIAATLKDDVAIVAKSRGYEMAKTGNGAMIRGELYIFPIGREDTRDGNTTGKGNERSGENYVVFLSVLGPIGGLGIAAVILLLLWTRITGKVLPCDGSLRRRRQSDEFVIMVNDLEDVT